jgi:predicted naringenin-chalcone synthase
MVQFAPTTLSIQNGNVSSTTVLIIIERLRARRAALPCVALAFGPGLVAEAALIQ